MKVLVFTSLFPNHVQPNNGIFIKQRMIHFAGLKGCEIRVVAPVPYCPPWPFLGKKWYPYSLVKKREVLEKIQVYHPRYPLIPKISMPLHGLSMFMGCWSLLRSIHDEFPFEIIDGHYIYPDGLAAVLLGKALGTPVVLSARGSDINQFSRLTLIRPMIRYALNEAGSVIAVTKALKGEMVRLGTPGERVRVVPNGIDPGRFFPQDMREARRFLSIPLQKKVILSIGSLRALKGFHLVLEAMPEIVGKEKDVHYYLIGQGPEYSRLDGMIKHMGLFDRVTLVGEIPNHELGVWYSAADVFCIPSSSEGSANVVVESLGCGTPVVATDIPGMREVVNCEDMGILVERNAKALAGGLLEALKRRWDRVRISDRVNGRSWDVVAREVQEVFSALSNRSGPWSSDDVRSL